MGAPAIFEKQIEIKLLHPASTMESRIQVAGMKKGAHGTPKVEESSLEELMPAVWIILRRHEDN
jgi:hypothetical protein